MPRSSPDTSPVHAARSPFAAGGSPAAGAWVLAARFAGAAALVVVGAVHLQQYSGLYSAIPTIGTLFVLNFAGAVAIALALVCPLESWAGRRGGALVTLAAAAGVLHAASSFVGLEISEHGSLFGFHEPGYDPTAISISRVAEVAAVVLLAAYLIGRFALRSRRW